jgi:hypothetical protein
MYLLLSTALWWMDVATVGAMDYLSTEATLIQRGGGTTTKMGWADQHRPTGPGLFRLASGPSFVCELLLSIGPSAPLHVGFGCHYPCDQYRGSCMNSGLLSWSLRISCHCVLVLATFGSKFILYLRTNENPWSSSIAPFELDANLSFKRVISCINITLLKAHAKVNLLHH